MDRFVASARLLCLASLWLLAAAPPPARAAAPPFRRLRDAEVARLVAQLGSDSFSVREEASRVLRMHQEAEVALRLALGSPDQEVRRRANRLLKGYRLWRANRVREQFSALVAQGRAGEFIERAVVWRDMDGAEVSWPGAGDLAWRMYQLPHFVRGRSSSYRREEDYFPWGGYRRFRAFVRHTEFRGDVLKLKKEENFCLACAERIESTDALCMSILVASSNIKVALVNSCVLLANGPVEVGPLPPSYRRNPNRSPAVHAGVLIADGEVRIRGKASGIIIASGKIICEEPPEACTLISASEVEVPKGTRLGTRPRETRITRNDPTLQGLVRFYSLASAGLGVRPSRRGLTVTALNSRKPFACAGVRAGDEILTVNGKIVRHPEALRVLLRRLAALGGMTELTIRRRDKVFPIHLQVQ